MNKLQKRVVELLKVKDAEAFVSALTSETDTDYSLENLVVRTSQEDEAFKSNVIEEIKPKIFEDAFEIQIRNLKKEHGLDFEGKKPEDFVKALKDKTLKEANVEPEKKVKELEESLDKLRTNLAEKDSKYSELENSLKSKEREFTVDSLIPELPETVGLSKEEARKLFFITHEVREDGVYRNGQKLKDQNESPIDLANAVKTFIGEKGWDKPAAPTGRGTTPPNVSDTPKTAEEYESYIKSKGLHPGSEEARSLLTKVVEENPDSF